MPTTWPRCEPRRKRNTPRPALRWKKLSGSWGYPVGHFLTHAFMAEKVKVWFDPEADYLVEVEGVD